MEANMIKLIIIMITIGLSSCSTNQKPNSNKGLFYQEIATDQQGSVKTEQLFSETMQKDWKYSIYYPAGYEKSSKKYPIIYILHGLTDNYTSWIKLGSTQILLDKAIAAGIIPASVVIFPDGQNTWYADIANTNMRTAFLNDLFPYVETNFQVINNKKSRAIGGQSMGGHGALVFALNNPDYFDSAFVLSPAITKLGKTPPELLIDFIKGTKLDHVYGNPFSQEKWEKYSYHSGYQKYLSQDQKVRFFVGIGSADPVTPAEDARDLIADFEKDNIEYEYMEVPNGVHTWSLWALLMEPSLKFVGATLSDKE